MGMEEGRLSQFVVHDNNSNVEMEAGREHIKAVWIFMGAHSNAPSWVKWDRVAPVKTALQGLLLHRWCLHEYSLFIVVKNCFPKPTRCRFTHGRTRNGFNSQKSRQFLGLISWCWSRNCLVLSPGSVHVSWPSAPPSHVHHSSPLWFVKCF